MLDFGCAEGTLDHIPCPKFQVTGMVYEHFIVIMIQGLFLAGTSVLSLLQNVQMGCKVHPVSYSVAVTSKGAGIRS